ncbi:MAG: hypothetical protein RL226_775, partial [Bacteroidota bacterium]
IKYRLQKLPLQGEARASITVLYEN